MIYKMLALDMDGTVLTDSKEITGRTLQAIERAMEKGIRVCISTGRAWPGSRKFLEQLKPNALVSNSNGSMITDPDTGEILFKETLAEAEAVRICEAGISQDATLIVWCGNRFYSNRLDEMAWDYSRRFAYVEPLLIPSVEELAKRGISKILWHGAPDRVLEWSRYAEAQNFKNVSVCTSEPDILELYSCFVSKAKAIEFIAARYGISLSEVIAVGDGENDIPMLEAAGLGIAMGNAKDRVKASADEVTLTNEEDGVAAVIEKYLL